MTELKPCPFCGVQLVASEEILRNSHTGLTHKQKVYIHPKTQCVLDYIRFHFYEHPWKVDAWNRRADNDR